MAFRIDLFARNMEITARIRSHVEKKITKLDRYLSNIDEARVDLSYSKSTRSLSDRQVAEITVRGRGFVLRTEERSDDIFTAFDSALSKMERKIEKFKGKRWRGRGDGRSAAEVTEIPAAEEVGEDKAVIVKRKKFEMAPMTEAEALDQMELLGHEDFFIFYNVDTGIINILYRRRDGSYGLIEPHVG